MLVSDEHNPFCSSPYGLRRVHTPNMARLAAEGATFQDAYCPSPLCLPSRSAFLSGLPVHRLQPYNNSNTLLDASPPTFGQAIRASGFHSVFMGKTDIYKPGSEMGFAVTAVLRDRRLPADVNFVRTPLAIRKGASKRADGYGVRPAAHDEDPEVAEAAERWLREQAPGRGAPWVLVANVVAPHFPHVTTQEVWDLYEDAADLPAFGLEQESARHPHAQDLRAHFETHLFIEEQARGLRPAWPWVRTLPPAPRFSRRWTCTT